MFGMLNHEVQWLGISLVDFCNLNCKYCSVNANQKGEVLEFSKIESFLVFFSEYACPGTRILLTGGEPTLHPHLLRIIDLIEDYFIDPLIQIGTNGVISPETLDALLDKRVSFYLSFEGLPEFQDFERPFHDSRGSSETVIKTIKKIISRDPNKLVIRINHSTNKIGKEKEMILFLKSLGVKKISLGVLSPDGRGENYPFVDFVRCSSFIPSFTKLLDEENFSIWFSKFSPRKKNWPSCGAGIESFFLSVDGKIVTCQNILRASDLDKNHKIFVVGDVNEGVKIDSVRLKKFNDFSKMIPEKCVSCKIMNYCGGCPFEKVIIEGKSIMNKEFCEASKLLIDGLLKLYPKK